MTDILVVLISQADENTASAIMDVFRLSDPFLTDDSSRNILDAIISNPDLLQKAPDFFLVDRLISLLPTEAERVFRMCMALLDKRGEDVSNIQTGLSSSAGELIDISLTLQQLHRHREKKLNLFEWLLELDAYGVKGVLFEIDRRSQRSTPPRPRRRRKRASVATP